MTTLESIGNTLNNGVKKVAEKSIEISKKIYSKSKEEIGKINSQIQSKNIKIQDLATTIKTLVAHQKVQELRLLALKFGPLILAVPGLRDLIMTSFLKLVGFTAAGVKAGFPAALFQAKYLGGYIAKDSIFAYLQSYGATALFDPTFISLILVGGAVAYYFYIYTRRDSKSNAFKWRFKDQLQKNEFNVPKDVSYKDGQFNIKWSNIQSDNDKHRKYFV